VTKEVTGMGGAMVEEEVAMSRCGSDTMKQK
jgi:hypothetical protein